METEKTPTPGVPLSAESVKLLVAHTIIEDLRVQHPGMEQIDNERGDLWLPGGSTPQSAGCVIDIHSVAAAVAQEMMATFSPNHTDLMVSPESLDEWLERNPATTPSDQGGGDAPGVAVPNSEFSAMVEAGKRVQQASTTPASGSDGLETVAWRVRENVNGNTFVHDIEPPALAGEKFSSEPLVTREAAEKRIGELVQAAARSNDEICQSLGRALEYPWFKDDQKNFPGATETNGVCVGDHVAESIADEAAQKIVALQSQVAALKAALDELQDVFVHDGESSMERFERLAEMFRKDTGYMAPGKDPGIGGAWQPEGDELRRIYDDWFSAKVSRARSVLQALALKEGR